MIEFEELKKKGELREKDALELVNEMVEEGSLEEEKGDKLKMALNKIYGTVAGFEEEKSNDDSMVTNSKAKKPVEESPSFWSKLQFWRKEEEK
tara:strand:+ start:2328 stop:2606 length:279 start_codon:yes stop_codon:yes gene_type:complete